MSISGARQKPSFVAIYSSESTVVLSMSGWHVLFHPLIQTSSRYFSRLKRVCRTQTFTSTERHISSPHSHLWVQLSAGSAFPQPDKNDKFLRFFNIIIKLIINFKIFSSISSDEIPPQSECKCSQNLYRSVAIHLKYVLLVLLLRLLKYLDL